MQIFVLLREKCYICVIKVLFMEKEISKAFDDYKKAVQNIVVGFCKKNDIEYVYDVNNWIDGKIGEIIQINDFYLDFGFIKNDLLLEAPKGEWYEYYNYSLELHQINNAYQLGFAIMNYESWLQGAPRIDWIKVKQDLSALEQNIANTRKSIYQKYSKQ